MFEFQFPPAFVLREKFKRNKTTSNTQRFVK